jgi:serine/threonine protein phosphatase PrpC
MQFLFFADAIQGQRSEQQDAINNLRLKNGSLLCVLSDGMGGVAGGSQASATVCSAFLRYFSAAPATFNPKLELNKALHEANRQLAVDKDKNPELRDMGATVIAVIIDRESGVFSYLSVGDSPLYQYRNGTLLRINENHAYSEVLKQHVYEGLMTQQEADMDPRRNSVTSAVMGYDIERIDQREGLLAPGEFLILASDGLQTLDDSANGAIARIVGQSGGDPDKAGRNLLRTVEAANRPDQDNTTLIIVGLAIGAVIPAIQSQGPAQIPQQRRPIAAISSKPIRPSESAIVAEIPKAKKKNDNLLLILLLILGLAFVGAFGAWWLLSGKTSNVSTNIVQPVPQSGGMEAKVAKPDDKKTDDTKPDDTKPDDTKPDDTKPDDTKTDDKKTDDKKTDDTKTDDTKTDDTKTDDTKTDDTKTDDTKTDGTKPGGTKPDDKKPDDKKPDGTKTDDKKTDGVKPDGKKTEGRSR